MKILSSELLLLIWFRGGKKTGLHSQIASVLPDSQIPQVGLTVRCNCLHTRPSCLRVALLDQPAKVFPQTRWVLRDGDVEPNPGPLWLTDDYAIDPVVLGGVLRHLDLPWPCLDAFATAQNTLSPQFWDIEHDAFSESWTLVDGLMWVNPPFHMFPPVLEKLAADRPWALLLVPGWNRPWFRTLWDSDIPRYRIPDEPIFRRGGRALMPPPAWPVWVFLFQRPLQRGRGVPLLCCGDVEANPGPSSPSASFLEFVPMASDFLAIADATHVAKAVVNIRIRTRSWPQDWTTHVVLGSGLSIERPDVERLCAAYELFADCTLAMSAEGAYGWSASATTGQAEEIAALRKELENLRIAATPATEDSLCSELSGFNLTRFKALHPGPAWMREMLPIFERYTENPMDDVQECILELWRVMVTSHFKYVKTFHKGSDHSSQATSSTHEGGAGPFASSSAGQYGQRSRPATFSVAEALRRGGTME